MDAKLTDFFCARSAIRMMCNPTSTSFLSKIWGSQGAKAQQSTDSWDDSDFDVSAARKKPPAKKLVAKRGGAVAESMYADLALTGTLIAPFVAELSVDGVARPKCAPWWCTRLGLGFREGHFVRAAP